MIKQQEIHKIVPIIKSYLFKSQNIFLIKVNLLNYILMLIKNHLNYQFKVLTFISSTDYPNNFYRFNIIYELLSIKYNLRFRIKIMLNEITPLNSIENIFIGAGWWENEIWDMFGVYFFKKLNITRLLTDYGFQGYPLRKDFPLSGFSETRFSFIKNRIVYENLELAQEYRIFDYLSVWEKK